jgi:cell division protease FtsH
VEDKRLHLESELRARIQMLLAGRGAERLHFAEVSSGAGQDLHEASRLALSMVASLGMAPSGSLLSLQAVRDAHLDSDPREALAEADRLLQELDRDCLALLQRLRPALQDITRRLLEEETVAGEAVTEAVRALLGEPRHADLPARPCHLERVAASPVNGFDPYFDLDVEEPQEAGPGMA